jgi:hypothetical protein
MIQSFGDLSGIEFLAKIGVEKDRDRPGNAGRNVIAAVIGPEHPQYASIMGGARPDRLSALVTGYAGLQVAAGPHTGPAPFWAR